MIRHSRLTALGIMLCLLAALFAVEAKIAWFSPAGSSTAQISYAKARPAEPPKALPQRFTSPAYDFTATATLVAAALLPAPTTVVVGRTPDHLQTGVSPGFRSSLFYRPPPVL